MSEAFWTPDTVLAFFTGALVGVLLIASLLGLFHWLFPEDRP